MVRDFGAGMTVDELIRMPAWHIARLALPRGEVFELAHQAAQVLVREGCEAYLLDEIWADGHTVWQNPKTRMPAVVTPGGLIVRGKN